MPKDTQPTATTDHAQLELPERVTVAVAELASAAREGLLALAWGTGLQVLQTLMAEDVARLVGPKGRHTPSGRRSATALGRAGFAPRDPTAWVPLDSPRKRTPSVKQ
jgi:putative transposase